MLSKNEKMISRPGNLSLEKANAARMVVVAVVKTLEKVTTTELMKYLSKGAVLKTKRKLLKFSQFLGAQLGGKILISAAVLNEEEIIQ